MSIRLLIAFATYLLVVNVVTLIGPLGLRDPLQITGITLGLTLLVSIPVFLVRRRTKEAVAELTEAVRRITNEQFGGKVYASDGDLGALARVFNLMSARLAEQMDQIKDDRQQLRTILGGLIEGVVAIDDSMRIQFVNHRAAELLEFVPDTAIGRKLWEVVRQRPLLDFVENTMAGDSPGRRELVWQGSADRSLDIYVAHLLSPSPRGAVIVIHDTTELRRLERLRQEFTSNVSHELKTPLSVIKACTESLIDGAADDLVMRREFLQQIDEQADRLHALILDLISLGRIETGKEVLTFDALDLQRVVVDCLDRHRPRSASHGLTLTLEATPAADFTVLADQEAVEQILDNLVDNAIKYTPSGGHINVRLARIGEQIRLDVMDTGIGIPERDLPRIFERFYRVDKARSRQLGGTGLGLSIVKHLVQLHQGAVDAVSSVGFGSTFTVTLPAITT